MRALKISGAGGRGVSGGSGSGGGSLLRVTLVHNAVTTVVSPTATADGQTLVVLLKQPSNAQGRVAWDSGFSADTPTSINTATNNSLARVLFVWSAADSKWIYIAIMNSGGTI